MIDFTIPETDMATTPTDRMWAVLSERERRLAGFTPRWNAGLVTFIVRMSAMVADDDGCGRVHSDDAEEWGWLYAPRFATLDEAARYAMRKAAATSLAESVVGKLVADHGRGCEVEDLRYEVVESTLSVVDDDIAGQVLLSVAADGRWAK